MAFPAGEKFIPRGGAIGGRWRTRVATSGWESERAAQYADPFRLQSGILGGAGAATARARRRLGVTAKGLLLKVPVGTIVYDEDTGEKVYDFSQADERVVIARGDAAAGECAVCGLRRSQAPREHRKMGVRERAEFSAGVEAAGADVGAGGFRMWGKSTLISRIFCGRGRRWRIIRLTDVEAESGRGAGGRQGTRREFWWCGIFRG